MNKGVIEVHSVPFFYDSGLDLELGVAFTESHHCYVRRSIVKGGGVVVDDTWVGTRGSKGERQIGYCWETHSIVAYRVYPFDSRF